jgi:hypothetical protein
MMRTVFRTLFYKMMLVVAAAVLGAAVVWAAPDEDGGEWPDGAPQTTWAAYQPDEESVIYLPSDWIVKLNDKGKYSIRKTVSRWARSVRNYISSINGTLPMATTRSRFDMELVLNAHPAADSTISLMITAFDVPDQILPVPDPSHLRHISNMTDRMFWRSSSEIPSRLSVLKEEECSAGNISVPVITLEGQKNGVAMERIKYAMLMHRGKFILLRISYLPQSEAPISDLTKNILSRWEANPSQEKEPPPPFLQFVLSYLFDPGFEPDQNGLLWFFLMLCRFLAPLYLIACIWRRVRLSWNRRREVSQK